MVKDLGKLQEELKKTTSRVNELGADYTKLLSEYDNEKKTLSKDVREASEKAIQEAKNEFNLKKKYAEDLFATLKDVNSKQLAEELLTNKESVEQSKAAGEEKLKNIKEQNIKILDAEAKFKIDIQAYNESINEKEIKKEAEKKAKEKKDKEVNDYKEKWKKIAEDTKGYTDAVNGALTNMFGATTKYMEKKKEMMQAELVEINKMLEEAQKDVAAKTLEIGNVKKKAQEEIDKKFKINHSDTNEEKDKKEADREAAYAEIEELQKLYDLKQQMATENAQHENGIGYQEKQLTAEQVARFDTLSGEHVGYVASLDEKTEAQKSAQYKEAELNTKKKKTEADIKKNDKQKQKVEAAQQYIAATVNIAQGVTKAWSLGPIIGPILAAVVFAAGGVQLGYMHAQINKLEDGGLLRGKRHSAGGMRILGSNVEVEGGEYVVNRESTDKNLGLIGYINSQRRQLAPTDLNSFFARSAQGFEPPFRQAFALGGQLPQIQNPMSIYNDLLVDAIQHIKFEPKVSVTDINTAQADVVKVDAWTGM